MYQEVIQYSVSFTIGQELGMRPQMLTAADDVCETLNHRIIAAIETLV